MPSRHRVVALCLPGLVAFDLTAPAQAFALAAKPSGEPLYEFSACSLDGDPVPSTSGFAVAPLAGIEALRRADTVVVPGYAALLDPPPEEALVALRTAADRGARLMSVCTGAFALAHAGVLDGRRATTHWGWAGELAKRFPAVRVEPDSLFVDEGEVLTSAGLSAGIDLSLHVIRRDFGAAAGERVARHMVAPPHRDGGQAQYFKPQSETRGDSLEVTRRWIAERLAEPLDVASMSRHAGVSPRTLARRLLEETDLPVETIAWRTGFGTAASLRDHFRRATATTPTAYRRSFQPAAY